ncbi:hypothetical protein [Streptomyces sp. NPDC097619]|uniref:hypothetical protein n=1 Tax=Streptomyces sp. NPDC097619 TaxID=3157228 RepID=UPI00331F8B1D
MLRERAGRLAAAAAALDPAGPGAAELRDCVERLAERCATASESLLGAAPRSSPRSGRE